MRFEPNELAVVRRYLKGEGAYSFVQVAGGMGTWSIFWLEGEEMKCVSGALGEPLDELTKGVVERAGRAGYHRMTTMDLCEPEIE